MSRPQASGDFEYTVFEREGPVAQFPTEVAAWTTAPVKPGRHKYYVRTWTSDFCVRLDLDAAPGKVYVLSLNPDPALAATASGVFAAGQFESPERIKMPGGPLLAYPYMALDVGSARRELASRESQVTSCIEHGDEAWEKGPKAVHSGGWDEIVFTMPPSSEK
jgi:hypothetical protein